MQIRACVIRRGAPFGWRPRLRGQRDRAGSNGGQRGGRQAGNQAGVAQTTVTCVLIGAHMARSLSGGTARIRLRRAERPDALEGTYSSARKFSDETRKVG